MIASYIETVNHATVSRADLRDYLTENGIKDQIQNMNLVIGCTIGRSYCYAHDNVKRYCMTKDFVQLKFFLAKLRMMDNV